MLLSHWSYLHGEKYKPIPTVPFDVLIKGHEGVIADRETYGPGDPTVSLVRTLHKDHKPEEILAVSYRLGALAKLLEDGEGKPWTFAVTNENYHMVNEALFRAAARARHLWKPRRSETFAFERDAFMKIALEESEADGTA